MYTYLDVNLPGILQLLPIAHCDVDRWNGDLTSYFLFRAPHRDVNIPRATHLVENDHAYTRVHAPTVRVFICKVLGRYMVCKKQD